MKAVPFILAAWLAGGVAQAQPSDPYGPPPPPAAAPPPGAVAGGPRAPGPLRAALLERFDANRDGRLEPGERQRAIKALRHLTRQLARQQMRERRRAARLNRVIRRYDVDGDGNVGPDEAPPAVQRRLRKLDRNGDGWVDNADF